ncbi:hypothetical protein EMIT0158MI4_70302 [Burkholderia ambifaria]
MGEVPASVKPLGGRPRRGATCGRGSAARGMQGRGGTFTICSAQERFLYHVVTYNSGSENVRATLPKRMTIRCIRHAYMGKETSC